MGVRVIEAANATTPRTDHELASGTHDTASQWFQITDVSGTIDSPLGGSAITGGDGYRLLFYVKNNSGSPGALSNSKHVVIVEGVIA